jgi:hypothetical protein
MDMTQENNLEGQRQRQEHAVSAIDVQHPVELMGEFRSRGRSRATRAGEAGR